MTPTDVAQIDGGAVRRPARVDRPAGPPTVIVVKTREPPIRASLRAARRSRPRRSKPPTAPPRPAAAFPRRVDRWFAESNFHHSEFADLGRLVALKEKQGLTISAVLPTLNEAATIGAIVRQRARS